jgi:uncharacterized protein (TIGR00255 family)
MTRLYSMTGYAGITSEQTWGSLGIELRTVNHRYLEVSWRGPEELRQLESTMREAIAARLSRGKVECRVNLHIREATTSGSPNRELLAHLAEWATQVRAIHPEARPPSVAELLAWPGMFRREAVAGEELTALALQLLASVLDDLTASRAREGDKLRSYLLERAQQIESLRLEVSPRIPELVRQYQERLSQRLREALGQDEEERVRLEVVLYASRIDVEEELARLGVHVTELRRVLERGGAVGKRLDFLMQELHREANTLGSKSVASQTSATALELKVLIEQMREQVQNLE